MFSRRSETTEMAPPSSITPIIYSGSTTSLESHKESPDTSPEQSPEELDFDDEEEKRRENPESESSRKQGSNTGKDKPSTLPKISATRDELTSISGLRMPQYISIARPEQEPDSGYASMDTTPRSSPLPPRKTIGFAEHNYPSPPPPAVPSFYSSSKAAAPAETSPDTSWRRSLRGRFKRLFGS